MADEPPKKGKTVRKKAARKVESGRRTRKKKSASLKDSPSKQPGISEDIVVALGKDEGQEAGSSQTIEAESISVEQTLGEATVSNSGSNEKPENKDGNGDVTIEVGAAQMKFEGHAPEVVISQDTSRKFWILQAKADTFDFRDNFGPGSTHHWEITNYQRQVQVGDIAFFWKTAPHRGIYGWGEITSLPKPMENRAGYFEFDIRCSVFFLFPIPLAATQQILGEKHRLFSFQNDAIFQVEDQSAYNLFDVALLYGNSSANELSDSLSLPLSDEVVARHTWLQDLIRECQHLSLLSIVSSGAWTCVRYTPPNLPGKWIDEERRQGLTLLAIDGTGLYFEMLFWQLALLEQDSLSKEYRGNLDELLATISPDLVNSSDENLKVNGGDYISFEEGEVVWKSWLLLAESLIDRLKSVDEPILAKLYQWIKDPDTLQLNDITSPIPEPIDEIVSRLLPFLNIVNDKWTVEDALGYDDYAEAITHFIKHEETAPPLAISVQAPWGAGKTSLMRMIQKKLDPEALMDPPNFPLKKKQTARPGPGDYFTAIEKILKDRRKNSEPKMDYLEVENWITIWFNPWKYESSDQIWAGLADSITRQIGDRLSLFDREWFYLQLHLRRINIEKLRRKFLDRQIDRLPSTFVYITGLILIALAVPIEMVQEIIKSKLPLLSFGPVGAVASGLLGTAAAVTKFWKSNITDEVNATKLSELVEVPDYDEKLGFRHAAEQDIKRIHASIPRDDKGKPKIAIFIDDLDRCSPSKIAKVFEAINLLVADDIAPCYFIIGMDGEIVSAALESHYEDLFSTIPTSFRTSSIGWHYLDKFVQLPFVIPPADPEKLKDMGREISKAQSPSTIALDDSEPGVKGNNKPSRKDAENTGNSEEAPSNSDEKSSEIPQPQEIAASKIIKDAVSEFEENVTDEIIARELIKKTGWDFDNNPRTLKRCLNLARFHLLVRFLKERRDQYRQSLHDDQNQNETSIPEKEVVIQWIYFSFRWPDAARWVQTGNSELVEGTCRKEKESGNQFTGLTSATRLNWLKENSTKTATSLTAWQTKLTGLDATKLETPPPEISWTNDRQLFDYCRSHDLGLLADNADKGFW